MTESKKVLLNALLTFLLYFWEASKIVLKKSVQLSISKSTNSHETGGQNFQGSRLRLAFRSTWKTMWTKVSLRKIEKQDWKLLMKLRQIYKKMSDRFTYYAKRTCHLNGGMRSWKKCVNGIFGKNTRRILRKGNKKIVQQGGKVIRRNLNLPFVRSCLQNLKKLRGQRRCKTWGEIVHSHDESCQTVIKKYNTRFQLYRKMPLKQMSRLWGQFNQLELPVWLRSPTLRLYIWFFNCCLEEAAIQDLKQYPNVGQFFQRQLLCGVRPIDNHPLTSPCDGTVLHCGMVTHDTLEQVKGVSYSLKGFLGPVNYHPNSTEEIGTDSMVRCWKDTDVEERIDYARQLVISSVNHLYHCIIYLAPGDYHRFHSPADWFVHSRRHFPGELFSVNPSIARWLQGLFSFNERVVYSGQWKHGYMSMTPVGATNVGSISIYHDKELLTNVARTWPSGCFYDKDFTSENRPMGVEMAKGQAFGHFSLGSTIVLLFEAPRSFRFTIKPGQKLKYGQGLGLCYRKFIRQIKKKSRTAKSF